MRKEVSIAIALVTGLIIGYFAGREHMKWQLINAVTTAFGEIRQRSGGALGESSAPKQKPIIIEKKVGDDIELATLRYRVTSIEESYQLKNSNRFSTPKPAKTGAKFVIVHMEIMNTTNKTFSYDHHATVLVDGKGRQFNVSNDSILGLDDYLEMRTLAPSITESGSIAYEVPRDAVTYSLFSNKRGSNEVFRVALK